MSGFLLPPQRRRIWRRNQKKSIFSIMHACSSDQIGLFRCFFPPFHLLCRGSSSARTRRSPFRASNLSKIRWAHCAGRQTGKLFWCIFVISMLLALCAYPVGCQCGGTRQRLLLGCDSQGACPGCQSVRQSHPWFIQKGWQIAGVTAISGA